MGIERLSEVEFENLQLWNSQWVRDEEGSLENQVHKIMAKKGIVRIKDTLFDGEVGTEDQIRDY